MPQVWMDCSVPGGWAKTEGPMGLVSGVHKTYCRFGLCHPGRVSQGCTGKVSTENWYSSRAFRTLSGSSKGCFLGTQRDLERENTIRKWNTWTWAWECFSYTWLISATQWASFIPGQGESAVLPSDTWSRLGIRFEKWFIKNSETF